MSPVPVSPRRVFGVDFSAARDAGDHIWVCRAHPGDDGIRIESVEPLSRLPGGASPRLDAMRALVGKVIESPRSAWGFDFCFALPAPVVEALAPGVRGHGAQIDVVGSWGSADALRRLCRAAMGRRELRRRTDREAATLLSPYNLRIYRQTFHGMVEVLSPLRRRPEVAVLPFDRLTAGRGDGQRLPFNRAAGGLQHIYVMEVCPASLLAALALPASGYKGRGGGAGARRQAIFTHLVRAGLVRPVPRALRRRIVEQSGGDALDALLAAVAAWRGYRGHDHGALRADPDFGREGFVYT